MSHLLRPSFRAWMLIPLCALAFLIWLNCLRVQRVEYVTGISGETLKINAASPTGYVGAARTLIVPEHNTDSYRWIAETQQMFANGEWRIRRIDYENAPFGREVYSASPYRWWLGLIAWLDHSGSGRPIGQSVERAALFADPLLHLLLVSGLAIFVAWQFGAFPAALVSVGSVAMYPFSAGFLPGAPDEQGIALLCALWSILPLLAGIRVIYFPAPGTATAAIQLVQARRRAFRWFFVAGIIGGFGMWISVGSQTPVLIGIVLGAGAAVWIARSDPTPDSLGAEPAFLWRAWALGGAAMCLLAYLTEFFPAHLGSWKLQAIHPLYAVSWLGAGELLSLLVARTRRDHTKWSLRHTGAAVFAIAAVAALPVGMWLTADQGFLGVDLRSFRLTKEPDGIMAPNLAVWISRDGFTAAVWATILPVLVIGPAVWIVARRKAGATFRCALAISLGPVLVALGFAYVRLRWWQMLDAALLALVVPATAAIRAGSNSLLRSWLWAGCAALAQVPGAIQILPQLGSTARNAVSLPEAEELVERDLAYWLAKRSGAEARAVVLAPPALTAALHYYGNLRGLGTFSWEDKDGITAALRIDVSNSVEESRVLISEREIKYIILPSWDTFFEDFTRPASNQPGELFIASLHRWALPPWLKPVPYQVPTIGGFGKQSALVFEVVDEQDDANALSRVAEYFVEMGQLDLAAAVERTLRRFPANLGALAARAQVAVARGDKDEFARTVDLLVLGLSSGGARFLAWDRRVSLAAALARANRPDLAREQVQRCLHELNEARVRSLTSRSLLNLLALIKMFRLEIADPSLRSLAFDLLPAEFRDSL